MKQWYIHFHLSHLRWWRRPSSSSALGNGRQIVIRHLLWTRLALREQRQPCSVSLYLQTIYTRLNVIHDSIKHSKQVPNCERSLSPWACSLAGFGVQLADGLSDFDGSPSPEAHSPPGGHSSILVGWSVGVCQTDYKLLWNAKRAFACGGLPCLTFIPGPVSAHVIACDSPRAVRAACTEEEADVSQVEPLGLCFGVHWGGFGVIWCRGIHKWSPNLQKRKSEPLLPPPPPMNETRSTLEWNTQPTQSEHHRHHWIATSKRALEGVRTSCTNQAHYSLVRMCTPCSKPHPPPNWRSRSGVVVTSYHVLFGSDTGAVHTHGPHIRMSVFDVHLVPLHHPVLSLIPLWLKANSQMTPSLLLPTWYA